MTTPTLDLFIIHDDIATAECGNRARCLLAVLRVRGLRANLLSFL
jgi:hypothetical protein